MLCLCFAFDDASYISFHMSGHQDKIEVGSDWCFFYRQVYNSKDSLLCGRVYMGTNIQIQSMSISKYECLHPYVKSTSQKFGHTFPCVKTFDWYVSL